MAENLVPVTLQTYRTRCECVRIGAIVEEVVIAIARAELVGNTTLLSELHLALDHLKTARIACAATKVV